MSGTTEEIDTTFTAPIRRDTGPGAWTIVVMPDSGAFFGTRKPVKVGGTIDGHAFEATLLPMGDGSHMVPIKAALRTAVGKGDGDEVIVHLDRRLG
jgi:hypothetical protein